MRHFIYSPGGVPQGTARQLPDTWTAPDGRTITGMTGLSDEEAASWGWVRVADRPDPPAGQYVTWDDASAAWVMADIVQPVPETVTALQLRRALLQANLLAAVESAVDDAGPDARLIWEYMTSADRNDPVLETLAEAVNLTSDETDAIFRTAATL
jgi:hypothetical protein